MSRARAFITGASSGLGLAYARHLAAEGYDLVLLARDRDRLVEESRSLAAEHGINAEICVADLSTPAGIAEARSVVESMTVDLLINNAGFGLKGGLLTTDPDRLDEQDRVLNTAVRELSLAAAKQMVSRGRGGIMTISSLAALTTMGQYAASKASAMVFTEALAGELAETPITVTAVLPGFIRTEFHERMRARRFGPRWIWLEPEHVVASSLRDARAGRAVSVPGWQYSFAALCAPLVPRRLIRRGSRGFSFRRT